jgi:hypothetical protein
MVSFGLWLGLMFGLLLGLVLWLALGLGLMSGLGLALGLVLGLEFDIGRVRFLVRARFIFMDRFWVRFKLRSRIVV